MVLGSSWSLTRFIYRFPNAASSYLDLETMTNALLTHRDYVFICVDVFVDVKRVGGHGTFMRVAADMARKDILNLFLEGHAAEYYPLLDPTIVILMCVKISNSAQRKLASDVGSLQTCSVFIEFLVSLLAMREVSTKRFTFKCTPPV